MTNGPGYKPPTRLTQMYRPLPPPVTSMVRAPNVDVTLMRDEEDNIFVNEAKRYMRPYTLVTEPNVITLDPISVNPEPLAGHPTDQVIMPIDNQGPMEIYYSMFESDGPFTVTIFDPDSRRYLSNREMHINTFAGTAQAPLIWKEPLLLRADTTSKYLFVTFRNLMDAPNNIRFTLNGRRLWHYQSPKSVIHQWNKYADNRRWTMPYFITTLGDVVSQGGVASAINGFFRNPDDSDFEWAKTAAAVLNIAGNPKQDYEVRIIEQSNQRNMMNNFILDTMVFGGNALTPFPTGILPFNLWESMYFEKNYKFQLQIRELGLDAQQYFVTLIGRKITHDQ